MDIPQVPEKRIKSWASRCTHSVCFHMTPPKTIKLMLRTGTIASFAMVREVSFLFELVKYDLQGGSYLTCINCLFESGYEALYMIIKS